MRMTITVSNLERVTRKLNSLERGDYLRGVADAGANMLQNEMRRYPPKPANSTYRRTMKLQQSWARKVSRSGDGWLAVVGSRIHYAPYVQDETRQAEVHQGRWQTIQSVAADKKDEVFNFMRRAIRAWLAKG